jgi:hypothetical protein
MGADIVSACRFPAGQPVTVRTASFQNGAGSLFAYELRRCTKRIHEKPRLTLSGQPDASVGADGVRRIPERGNSFRVP